MTDRSSKKTKRAMDREIWRYLRTGKHDHEFIGWPGDDFLTCLKNGKQTMEDALIAEVRRLESGHAFPKLPADVDSTTFAREKVTPMVTGLFPAKEREIILGLLERSLVFLTHDNIEQVLREQRYLSSAWDLANLYLGSIGSKCLNGKPSYLVGLSQETTCFVSTDYFNDEDPFADFVVHEAAHVFHNWKRDRVGLPHTRYQEWLLPIDFAKREEFAYACEAYGRILERAKNSTERRQLHAEYAESWVPSTDRVNQDELSDILAEAVNARNGWKRILKRCAPPKRVPMSVWIKQAAHEAVIRADRSLATEGEEK